MPLGSHSPQATGTDLSMAINSMRPNVWNSDVSTCDSPSFYPDGMKENSIAVLYTSLSIVRLLKGMSHPFIHYISAWINGYCLYWEMLKTLVWKRVILPSAMGLSFMLLFTIVCNGWFWSAGFGSSTAPAACHSQSVFLWFTSPVSVALSFVKTSISLAISTTGRFIGLLSNGLTWSKLF